MKANVSKDFNWEEWDRVVGYKLAGTLVGYSGDRMHLTENQWAKQYITGMINKAVAETVKTHNLIALAMGKTQDGKFYDKEIRKRIENLITELTWQADKNNQIVKNLKGLF